MGYDGSEERPKLLWIDRHTRSRLRLLHACPPARLLFSCWRLSPRPPRPPWAQSAPAAPASAGLQMAASQAGRPASAPRSAETMKTMTTMTTIAAAAAAAAAAQRACAPGTTRSPIAGGRRRARRATGASMYQDTQAQVGGVRSVQGERIGLETKDWCGDGARTLLWHDSTTLIHTIPPL